MPRSRSAGLIGMLLFTAPNVTYPDSSGLEAFTAIAPKDPVERRLHSRLGWFLASSTPHRRRNLRTLGPTQIARSSLPCGTMIRGAWSVAWRRDRADLYYPAAGDAEGVIFYAVRERHRLDFLIISALDTET